MFLYTVYMHYQDVYAIVAKIPQGKVSTYGQIAALLGNPHAARFVGYALSACKDARIPCHRVVDAKGQTKSAFDILFPDFQRFLLEKEKVPFRKDGTIDLNACLWTGNIH